MTTIAKTQRFSRNEDLANAYSHLFGALLSVAALTLLVVFAAIRGNAWHIVSFSIFGTSMIFLYTSSTIAHWLPEGRAKDSFFTIDQVAIYILIAGTYTPLSLVALRGPLGWIIFGLQWGFALFGIFRLLIKANKFERGVPVVDIILYAGMGWMVVFVAGAVLKNIPLMGFIWILIGGLFYTLGIIFFKVAKFKYHHLVWHLMVIGGSVSHFTAVFFYML
ncbi:MAG: hemolysin III family protein [Bacteroidales bacterium]|jgi:hemolysin III|nr:hemolysin III family protein [Bacteroidales bacterium]